MLSVNFFTPRTTNVVFVPLAEGDKRSGHFGCEINMFQARIWKFAAAEKSVRRLYCFFWIGRGWIGRIWIVRGLVDRRDAINRVSTNRDNVINVDGNVEL